MNFFVPAAEDSAQAERVYEALAKFNHAPVNQKRIWALHWKHNGQNMSSTVGLPLPAYYGTGEEPVLAIFDCGSLYKICTENRGGVRGEAVLAGNGEGTTVVYFEAN